MTSTAHPAAPAGARPGDPCARGDLRGDILAEAYRPETAAPVAIHVRPELGHLLHADPSGVLPPTPLPLVVDDDVPASPGYEIYREPPRAGTGPGLPPLRYPDQDVPGAPHDHDDLPSNRDRPATQRLLAEPWHRTGMRPHVTAAPRATPAARRAGA